MTRYLHHVGFLVLPLAVLVLLLLKFVPLCLKIWTNFWLKRAFKRLAVVEKGHAAGKGHRRAIGRVGSHRQVDRADVRAHALDSGVHRLSAVSARHAGNGLNGDMG